MNELDRDNLTFEGRAVYRIRVQGRIRASWSDRLEGMTITVQTLETGPSVTTLVGELGDQASLVRVLSTLYELHLPVLSVECLNAVSK